MSGRAAGPVERPLYLKIYLACLAMSLFALFVSGVIATSLFGRPASDIATASEIGVAASALPDHREKGFDRAWRLLNKGEEAEIALFDRDGRRVAGDELPMGEPGLFRHRGARMGLRLSLPDGRTVAIARKPDPNRRLQLLSWLSAVAAVLAVGSMPVARGITRRLEQLQGGMARFSQGDLDARAPVSGRDEVAAVALAFNDAADRVQRLFSAQQRVLASASHDLRTPLARLRMALELLSEGADPRAVIPDAIADIEELDATVGDVLQVARMAADARVKDPRPVSMRAVVLPEAARVGATVAPGDLCVLGDERLLRRMARNLLENAMRHGAPPVEVVFGASAVEVRDRGPGVPSDAISRIFEPFFRPEGHAEGRDGSVGLGLHLVREIARFHGGDAQYLPREGGGSRFIVSLPADAEVV